MNAHYGNGFPLRISLNTLSFDFSADGVEFFFDFFIASVDVVDTVYDRLAVSGKCGKDKGGRRAQI